jgi:ribosomal-protein-alanine N-acetyltransferase
MIPTLHTDRLTLRAPRWDDFEAYAAFRASPRMVTTGGPFTRDQAFTQLSALLGHWVLRGYGRWMVADRKSDAPLGIVGLYFPEGWPEPELAWSLFDDAEGRGIAQEAAVAAREYAYGALRWDTLISAVDPDNTRSVALAKRMGCVQEAPFQHETYGALHVWRHPAPEVSV